MQHKQHSATSSFRQDTSYSKVREDEAKPLPSFESIVLRSAADLGSLLGDTFLPQTYSLDIGKHYCFVYRKFLYGIYLCTARVLVSSDSPPTRRENSTYNSSNSTYHSSYSQKLPPIPPIRPIRPSGPSGHSGHSGHIAEGERYRMMLHKVIPYHRLRLHHTSDPKRLHAKLADKRLLANLFRDENKQETSIFLRIVDQNDHYLVSCAGAGVPHGIQHHRVREPYAKIRRLGEIVRRELAKPHIPAHLRSSGATDMFGQFLRWGQELATSLLHKDLQKSLMTADIIHASTNSNLPFHTLMLPSPSSHAAKPLATISTSLPQNRLWQKNGFSFSRDPAQLGSLGVFTSEEDLSMREEIKSIAEKYRLERTAPPRTRFGLLSKNEVLAGLIRYELVHLIYHGEILQDKFTLMRKGKAFLSFDELREIKVMPKVLFLSTCFSEHPDVIQWFFTRGGRSLLTTYGETVANEFPEIMRSFYWQLLTRRCTIRRAFHSVMRGLFQKRDITVFKLRLHGYGEEYFSRRETL